MHSKYCVTEFANKYVDPDQLIKYIKSKAWNYKSLGYSQENREIYAVSIGEGESKLAFWSQMHGNESTATRAMLDLFNYLTSTKSKLLKKYTLKWIPQLNPDGAKRWSRLSYSGIDINRDFVRSATPEMRILKDFIFSDSYKCIFNLHDQRNIFYTSTNHQPTNIALLAPVTGLKEEPANYYQSKSYLNRMIDKLQMYTYVNLAKFNNDFYPLATGDNFQRHGIPTILVEAGYLKDDHQRMQIREQLFYFFLSCLEIDYSKADDNYILYDDLPNNHEAAYDIIFKNVSLKTDNTNVITDLGIRYIDELIDDKVYPKAVIHEIGDLKDQIAYETFDAANRIYQSLNNNTILPERGKEADFLLGDDIKVENGEIKTII